MAETVWFNMTPEKCGAHLRKVASTPLSSSLDVHATTSQGHLQPSLSLSLDVNSVSEMVNIPLPCLEGIWKKATELLNTLGSISSALGHPEDTRMVMSHSGHRPHLVLPCTGGRYKCDGDCLNYKSLGICSQCNC